VLARSIDVCRAGIARQTRRGVRLVIIVLDCVKCSCAVCGMMKKNVIRDSVLDVSRTLCRSVHESLG
jgi:hypothetical protein